VGNPHRADHESLRGVTSTPPYPNPLRRFEVFAASFRKDVHDMPKGGKIPDQFTNMNCIACWAVEVHIEGQEEETNPSSPRDSVSKNHRIRGQSITSLCLTW